MTRLVEQAVSGETVSATRAFADREAPWRAVADSDLRVAFLDVGGRLLTAMDALPSDRLVPFTGWAMNREQLRTHARSELALHRWDLVGDDNMSVRLLAQPDLIAHGRLVLSSMPTLAESRRTTQPSDDLLSLWGRRPNENNRPRPAVQTSVSQSERLSARDAPDQPPDREPANLRMMLYPAGHPFCLWTA